LSPEIWYGLLIIHPPIIGENHMRRSISSSIYLSAVLSIATTQTMGQTITEDRKIVPANATSSFGRSISVDEGVVAAGDPSWNSTAGSAQTFNTTSGLLEYQRLNTGPNSAFDFLGSSIALDDGLIAIGIPGDNFMGSMQIYSLTTSLHVASFAPSGVTEGGIGAQIDMDDGLVAASAPLDAQNGNRAGAAYLLDIATNTVLHKLLADDGQDNDNIGTQGIAIDNGVVAVTSYQDDDQGTNAGAVYLFDVLTGNQIAKLFAFDPIMNGFFGISISMNDGILAVGARSGTDGISGRVYLFDVATLTPLNLINISDMSPNFGGAVAIDNSMLVVSDISDNELGTNAGAAYLFNADTGDQIAKLLPSDGAPGTAFGSAVSIDNGIIAVSSNPVGTGAVYIFSVPQAPCAADLTGDGTADIFDVLAFIEAYNTTDPAADFTNDGTIDIFDVLAFIKAYNAGCP
jgi:hypothetical protein